MKKVFLLALFIITFHLNASEFLLTKESSSSHKLYTYLEFFKDADGTYSQQNLEKLSHEKFFKADKELQHLGLSFQYKAIWARFQVFNDLNSTQNRVLYFKNITEENILLFEKSGLKVKQIANTGTVNDFYFTLTLEPKTHKEYYVKFKANGPYIIDAKMLSIKEANTLNYNSGLFFASFAAFMFIVILLYITFFIAFKQKMYLYFALYLVSHLLFWLALYGVYRPFDLSLIKVITLASSAIFIALVSFDLLNMRENMRGLYRAIITIIVLLFGYYIFTFYLQLVAMQAKIFAILYLSTYLLLFVAIVRAIFNKHKEALYFLFAILGYFIGYNITIAGVFASAIVPVNNFTLYVGMLGVIVDVVFASIAFIIAAKKIYDNQKKQLEEYSKTLESKVLERTKKIEEQNILLQKLSSTDALTQLNNRMELDKRLEKLFMTKNQSLYLIMIDIDFFKKVNDTYGHLVGDSVLKQVAKILKKSLKEKDTIGRWGGEEFLIVFTAKNETDALAVAQRIRKHVEADVFEEDLKITISLGLSSIKNRASVKEWVQKCDEALYKAKNSGRNRVVVAK